MIVGLIGSICSGKETLAKYLVDMYGFEAINILDLFRERIAKELLVKNGPREEHCENEDEAVENFGTSSPAKHFEGKEQGEHGGQTTLQLNRIDSSALNLSQEASLVYDLPEAIL